MIPLKSHIIKKKHFLSNFPLTPPLMKLIPFEGFFYCTNI
nr:MAG TPA: hypothetical protein [Caudoviricetes sp.]